MINIKNTYKITPLATVTIELDLNGMIWIIKIFKPSNPPKMTYRQTEYKNKRP